MKKVSRTLMSLLIIIGICSINPVFAAIEEPHKFSCVDDYYDLVYTIDYYGTNGGINFTGGNVNVSGLPYGMMNLGNIYSFCIYGDRIYYLTAQQASDWVPAHIYSCNMLGGDNVLIADNASNFSNCYIVDGVLYYDAFYSEMYGPNYDYFYKGYYGGIYKINLNDYGWAKLVSGYAQLTYCDGDYIYYYVGLQQNDDNCYAVSVDGSVTYQMSRYIDEYDDFYFLKGNVAYFIQHADMYQKERNTSFRYNSKLVSEINGTTDVSKDSLLNVTSRYIYYCDLIQVPETDPYGGLWKFAARVWRMSR